MGRQEESRSKGLLADPDDLGTLTFRDENDHTKGVDYKAIGQFQVFANMLQSLVFYLGEANKEQVSQSQQRLSVQKALGHAHECEKTYRDQVRRFESIAQEAESGRKVLLRDITILNAESKEAREQVLDFTNMSLFDFATFKFMQWRIHRAKIKANYSVPGDFVSGSGARDHHVDELQFSPVNGRKGSVDHEEHLATQGIKTNPLEEIRNLDLMP